MSSDILTARSKTPLTQPRRPGGCHLVRALRTAIALGHSAPTLQHIQRVLDAALLLVCAGSGSHAARTRRAGHNASPRTLCGSVCKSPSASPVWRGARQKWSCCDRLSGDSFLSSSAARATWSVQSCASWTRFADAPEAAFSLALPSARRRMAACQRLLPFGCWLVAGATPQPRADLGAALRSRNFLSSPPLVLAVVALHALPLRAEVPVSRSK